MSFAVGVVPHGFYDRLGHALDHLVAPKRGDGGPVQDVVLLGEQADLTQLPIPVHFEQDAGPYITAGMAAASIRRHWLQ